MTIQTIYFYVIMINYETILFNEQVNIFCNISKWNRGSKLVHEIIGYKMKLLIKPILLLHIKNLDKKLLILNFVMHLEHYESVVIVFKVEYLCKI